MALRCLITTSSFGKQSPEPLELLANSGFEVTLNPFGRKLRKRETLELYARADVVIAGVEEIDREVFEACPHVRIISRCGTGVDAIDLGEAEKRRIRVLTTPEPPAQAVAELTIGLIFAVARRIAEADALIRARKWSPLMGSQIKGKKLGIVGFGRVGKKVADVFHALGASIAVFDPVVQRAALEKVEASSLSMDEVFATADIVTLHLPLNDRTRNLANASLLSKMKPGAILINTSRGGVVDEAALLECLESGQLSGAGLDVFEAEPYEGPLVNAPNTVLTAHMGSYAKEARTAMEIDAAKNLMEECLKQNLHP
jgi:D-3-phosphoglycerate dehydrogenase